MLSGANILLCHHEILRPETKKKCARPRRLELLINQFANMDIVQVHNVAVDEISSEKIGNKMISIGYIERN